MIRRLRLRPVLLAALLLALAAGLSACGAKQDVLTTQGRLQRVDLVLDYLPNADHAPIYAAQAIGAFRQAGLDVHIHTPSDPSEPLRLVEAGRDDIAISYEPEVLLARDKTAAHPGARIAAIGALVQQPLTSIISLDGKVRTPADLRGKTVGTAGVPYQSAYLKTILAQAGVPSSTVKQVDVNFNLVPALLSKRVDAILGGYWNYEAVQLRLAHKRPSVIRMDKVGVPTYQELVFVANFDDLHNKGTMLRRFLQAVSRGARAVQRNPAVGIDALLKANPDLERPLQSAAVKATLPTLFPADKAFPWGYMDSDDWLAYGRWMLAHQLIKRLPSPVSLTNEYLPGRGI